MPAVDTLLLAFRASVLDEFLLDFILAAIASKMRSLEDQALRYNGDAWFYCEVVLEYIGINLRLWEWCIKPRPNTTSKKITDLRIDDDASISQRMGFACF